MVVSPHLSMQYGHSWIVLLHPASELLLWWVCLKLKPWVWCKPRVVNAAVLAYGWCDKSVLACISPSLADDRAVHGAECKQER